MECTSQGVEYVVTCSYLPALSACSLLVLMSLDPCMVQMVILPSLLLLQSSFFQQSFQLLQSRCSSSTVAYVGRKHSCSIEGIDSMLAIHSGHTGVRSLLTLLSFVSSDVATLDTRMLMNQWFDSKHHREAYSFSVKNWLYPAATTSIGIQQTYLKIKSLHRKLCYFQISPFQFF